MKKIGANQVKKNGSHLTDLSGLEKLPALAAFLCDTLLEGNTANDNEPREPGGIWIQPRNGVLNVLLKEPTQGMLCRLEVASVKELWATVESALKSEADVWEVDPNARKKKNGRRT